ncbi:delta(24(24(1)))-sterol reductase [Amylocarpus encephaloides]|uniref:Delta(24(24(1)))-sterol reductase n=1 Tax=Amylocarpus encephaloides TaxID=45428 RepID=A0A9P7YTJ3_9HELO|nr:delta(24(24(1)))-sterol reductase [Amylocarpus encephaloides]
MAANTNPPNTESMRERTCRQMVEKEKDDVGAQAFAKEHLTGGWRPGMDPKVDYSGHFEFGGSLGTLALMIAFPTLMYYMWIGATFYDGQFPLPQEGESKLEFGKHLLDLVYTGAFPHLRAWKIYWVYFIFEAACYLFMPGFTCYGKPLAHANGMKLKYHCSAFTSFYLTIFVMAGLHGTGIFPIYTLLDEFGPIMSVAILSGFLCSFIAYFSAFARGAQHRVTGHPIYDFFMGAELNPRLFGIIDFKMFYEVRIPWYILFGMACAAATRQYEQYDFVSGEVMFVVMAFFLYANACAKAEQYITTTWDMYQEKMGFMLTFWNMAGVPMSYCHGILYLANHEPSTYSWNKYALAAFFSSYLFVYWVWDTANSQKNSFRMMERGTFVKRQTFPQLPWQELDNPKTIVSDDGDTILVDGWYGLARKVHYSCDWFFAVSWGLITGFNSPFPWFYSVFFTVMIIHRVMRDITKCRTKYGAAWKEYEKRVPYLFIPYVF